MELKRRLSRHGYKMVSVLDISRFITYNLFMRHQTREHIEKKALSRRRGSYFNCIICDKKFWRKPFEIKNGNNKFHSRRCYFRWQIGKSKNITNRRSYLGSDNPNWKGGIKPINLRIRGSKEFRIWRHSVWERDNYTCKKCGKKKSNYIRIEAHHIKPFATFPKLRFSIDNGLTLCKKCHDKEPKGKEIYLIRR